MDALHQLLQHLALGEPRTWLFVAVTIACAIAGWHCADFLFDTVTRTEE
jgi:hypothetical protein